MQYLATVMPKNAVGIVALSWVDFYPDESLNSILGEGSVQSGCAAISFGHYGQYTPISEAQSFNSNRGKQILFVFACFGFLKCQSIYLKSSNLYLL